MEDKNNQTNIKNLLDSAKSVIIVIPPDPSKDLVIAAASLHLALKETGKISQIGCGSEVHVDSEVAGVSEITDTIGSRNLVISFDYREEDLDKVDYDIREDGKFYLLIKPKTNSPVPDASRVKYSYSGAAADLVITLGITSLEELGKIYADEKNFLDNADIINLNNSLRPAAFSANVYHHNLGSFSEIVASFMETFGLKATLPVANNLLTHIYDTTQGLTSSHLTADTFAALAFLMRSGAQLPHKEARPAHFSQPPFFEEIPAAPIAEEEIPLPEEENQSVPSDWNKPKIFRVTKKDPSSN